MKLLLFACFVAAASALSLEVRHESVSLSGGSCRSAVSVYQHDGFGGRRGDFRAGACDFHCFIRKMYNDQASSIKVPKGCVAYLYQHAGFRGWRAIFPPGNYNMRQFMARGARNDDASSIKVFNQRPARPPTKAKRCNGRVVNVCSWKRSTRCGHTWRHRCYKTRGWRRYRYRCRRSWFRWGWCTKWYLATYTRCHRFRKPFCVRSARRSCKKVCRQARPVQSGFYLKYASKWPHCENIACPTRVHLSHMKSLCAKHSNCNGFSWTRGSTSYGWGCLKKNCHNNGRNGFGHGSHGYWVKRARRAPAKTWSCTLSGDPHIKSFTMQRGYYNHYDMGLYTAFKKGFVHVQVLNGRSTTWRNNAVIHSVRVNYAGKHYAVGINQRTCQTSGNLRSTMRFGSVTVQWQRSCRRRVGDRHFNVKITYKGANLSGISGSCIKKPKKRISWAAVNRLAQQRCGKDWKNTIAHMKRNCGSRQNMACYNDQIYKICAKRSAKLRAAANAKRLALYYKNAAARHDKNSKNYKWYQKNFASKAERYIRSAKGYHARANAHAKSEFTHKSSRAAYLRQRAAHLRNAARHSRSASTYAHKAWRLSRSAAAANRRAAAANRSAAWYLKMANKYKGYARSHRVRASQYSRESAAHGRTAEKWRLKAQQLRAKAAAASRTANKYNAKIRRFCTLWKRLAGQHAQLASRWYRQAATANGHLLRSKRYKASAERRARSSVRSANYWSRIAGSRMSGYYSAKARAAAHRRQARAHNNAAAANRRTAARFRRRAAASRRAAAQAGRKAGAHGREASRHGRLARHYKNVANSHTRIANAHKRTANAYGRHSANSARAAKANKSASDRHARAAAAAAKAAAALGL